MLFSHVALFSFDFAIFRSDMFSVFGSCKALFEVVDIAFLQLYLVTSLLHRVRLVIACFARPLFFVLYINFIDFTVFGPCSYNPRGWLRFLSDNFFPSSIPI